MSGIRIANCVHAYGSSVILHGIDVELPGGRITAILGPSGCGKSTLLRCIAGHEPIRGGRISCGDTLLCDASGGLPPERRRIGMVFQDHALFPHRRLWQNVAFGLRHLRRRQRREQAQHHLERVGLGALAERYPHQCSGGQQQRCALARALAPQPRALLLDEPFSGLDANLRDSIREETLGLLRASGITCAFVTHDPEEALGSADHLILMQAGRIVQSGDPATVWDAPVDADALRLLAPVVRIPGHIRDGMVESALGRWPAERPLPDGPVRISLRADALRADPAGSISAVITEQRFLGSDRLSELQLADQVRISIKHSAEDSLAHHGIATGTELRLHIDPRLARIEPRSA